MRLVPRELRSHLRRTGDAKRSFPIYEVAASHAQRQTNPRRGPWYRAYRCRVCDNWHVGRGPRP